MFIPCTQGRAARHHFCLAPSGTKPTLMKALGSSSISLAPHPGSSQIEDSKPDLENLKLPQLLNLEPLIYWVHTLHLAIMHLHIFTESHCPRRHTPPVLDSNAPLHPRHSA